MYSLFDRNEVTVIKKLNDSEEIPTLNSVTYSGASHLTVNLHYESAQAPPSLSIYLDQDIPGIYRSNDYNKPLSYF